MEIRPPISDAGWLQYRHQPVDKADRESWEKRSEYLLGMYEIRAARVRRYFGLDAPTGDLRGVLEAAEARHPTRPGARSAKLDVRAIDETRWLPHFANYRLRYMDGQHELYALAAEAGLIAEDLGLSDASEAAAWILTGRPFALPWIDVDVKSNRFGVSAIIRVGSQDVPAEEVRSVYQAVMVAEMGPERRALHSDTIALALHEAEWRAKGASWAARYEEWIKRRAEIGAARYDFGTWRAYRNQVVTLPGRAAWIDQLLAKADEDRRANKVVRQDSRGGE